MPNTLAHFGVQGPLARLAAAPVDVRWVLLGCILPDVPWILRRAVTALAGGAVDPVALRLYAIVQASLLFSLVLSAALALLSARPGPVFGVLALGSLLHLLLDALQTKWGNGAHLFAPVSWEPLNFGLFWSESGVTVALTAAGVAYLAWEAVRKDDERVDLAPSRSGALAAGALAVAYLAVPPAFYGDVVESGSHSLETLVAVEDRTGRTVELDRVGWRPAAGGEGSGTLRITGGELAAVGRLPWEAATVSVRGTFVDHRTLRVTGSHTHASLARELASVAGLAVLAGSWIRGAVAGREGRAS